MKHALLIRRTTSDAGTFGTLVLLDSGWSCYTAEPPWRGNRRNESCIPSGLYEASYLARSASGKFRNVYLLRDVEDRGGILIHSGNYAGDTAKGLKTNSNGCILVGTRRGVLGTQPAVLGSRLALRALVDQLGREPVRLWIADLSAMSW